jgi:hypothetical protein
MRKIAEVGQVDRRRERGSKMSALGATESEGLSEAVAGLEIDGAKSQEKAAPATKCHFHPGRVYGRVIASAYSFSFERN